MENKKKFVKWNWNREKVLCILCIAVFVISFFAAYMIDACIIHPIPAPKGTALRGRYYTFDLSQSNCAYADAKILYENVDLNDDYIFMVEKDGSIHLLYFEMHYPTQRRRLADDKVIEPGSTQTVKLHTGGVELVDGEVVFSYNSIVRFNNKSYGISLLIALATTVAVVLPVGLLTKPRKSVH